MRLNRNKKSSDNSEQRIREILSIATLEAIEFVNPEYENRVFAVTDYLSRLVNEIPLDGLKKIAEDVTTLANTKLTEVLQLEKQLALPINDNNKGE